MAKNKAKKAKPKFVENKHINPYRPSTIRRDAERDYEKFKERLDAGEMPSTVTKGFEKKIGTAFLCLVVVILLMVLITLVF